MLGSGLESDVPVSRHDKARLLVWRGVQGAEHCNRTATPSDPPDVAGPVRTVVIVLARFTVEVLCHSLFHSPRIQGLS